MAQPSVILFRYNLFPKFLCKVLGPFASTREFSTTDTLKSTGRSKQSRQLTNQLRDLARKVDRMKFKGVYHNFKRSQFVEWNYDAELFAFGERLNETFDGGLLREAFTDISYVNEEKKRLEEVGIKDSIELISNRALADTGKALIEDFTKKYFRTVWSLVPEEGVEKVVEYLTSVKVLGNIGNNLGLKDLILCNNYPPTEDEYAKGFCAVVGALNASSGIERTHNFIKDFVATQMTGKSIWDVWEITDPLRVLDRLTEQCGLGSSPEPRMLGHIGQNTLESVYHIGIYIDKELFESGYGETIEDGVKCAAVNSISKLFDQSSSSPSLPIKTSISEELTRSDPNKSLEEWDGKQIS